ncbi:VOC family protein [Niveispirillum sp.]|uniref:VOC family protein n=1 Tax=Niveispirillum sp. TaxID=1917217 RepID=UPI001B44C483|nr:VOC family protein [Niveispirillum sp.]MBP7336529.1 VOC family protein [Niveispirillum sp.]
MQIDDREMVTVALPGAAAPLLRAHLAAVALTSPDPQALAGFYQDALGYEGQWLDGHWTGRLGARRLMIGPGAANNVDHTIFAVPYAQALSDLRGRLASAGISVVEARSQALSGAAIRFSDPDGNVLLFGVADPAEEIDMAGAARLQHIVFASDEAPAMVRFYCDIVGFTPSDYVRDEGQDLTSAFLRCGEEHHSLAVFRAPRKRLDHLCYDVTTWTDIRDWADRFAARHIKLRWGPGRHGPGNNLFLFINDPDGNWLEFSTELEQVVGSRPVKTWVHEERTLNSWGSAFLRS